jgi:hypothetical protein
MAISLKAGKHSHAFLSSGLTLEAMLVYRVAVQSSAFRLFFRAGTLKLEL